MKLIPSIGEFIYENVDIVFKIDGLDPENIEGFKKVGFIGNWIDLSYASLINSYLNQTEEGKSSPVDLSNYTKKFTYGNILYHFINNTNYQELNKLKIPMMNWGSKSWMDKIAKKGYKPNPKYLYNKTEEKQKAFMKSTFYKLFEGEDFITKTVYSENDVKKLNFPIVAKPDRGHTGLGITKFDSYEEFKKYEYKDSFNLYQEAIKIEKEIRIGVLKDNVIFYFIRKPMDNKSKFLAGKEKSDEKSQKEMADKELDFKYIIMTPEDFYSEDMLAEDILNIVKIVREKVKLEFIVFDIAIDKNNNKYVLEINVHPGIPGATLSDIYLAVYEDFYGEPFPEKSLSYIKTINNLLISSTVNLGKYVYSNSYIKKNILK